MTVTHLSDPQTQCDFGVVRSGAGNAEVHVTRPRGSERVLTFSGTTVTTQGMVKDERFGEEWQIEVNDFEKYRIPEAVVSERRVQEQYAAIVSPDTLGS